MKSLVFFDGVREGFTPATRKHIADPGFFGHTLIAQKKDDVLSDKFATRWLTSCFFGDIMTRALKKAEDNFLKVRMKLCTSKTSYSVSLFV